MQNVETQMENPLISIINIYTHTHTHTYIYQKIGILNLQLHVQKSNSSPQLTPSIFGIL